MKEKMSAIKSFLSKISIFDIMALVSFVSVIGFMGASMAHVYNFSLLFNEPFFGVLFTIAMELGLVGTTVVYSLRGILNKEEELEVLTGWAKIKASIFGRTQTPMQKAKKFAQAAVGIIFTCLYFINVASAYMYFIDHNETKFIADYAEKLLNVFLVGYLPFDIPDAFVIIFLSHIAAGILPFGGYVFGKMVALSFAQKEDFLKQEKEKKQDNLIDDPVEVSKIIQNVIAEVNKENKINKSNSEDDKQINTSIILLDENIETESETESETETEKTSPEEIIEENDNIEEGEAESVVEDDATQGFPGQ